MEEGGKEEQGTCKNIKRAMYGIPAVGLLLLSVVQQKGWGGKLVSPKPEQGKCHWLDIKATHLTAVLLG